MTLPQVVCEPDPFDPAPARTIEAMNAFGADTPVSVSRAGSGRRMALASAFRGSPLLRVAGRWDPEGVRRFLVPAWVRFQAEGLHWAVYRPVLRAAVPIASRSGAEFFAADAVTGRKPPGPGDLYEPTPAACEFFFADRTAVYCPVPAEVAPSPTGECNFRCANCYLVDGLDRKVRSSRPMDPALFASLTSDFASAGGRNLKIGDTFEALLHPGLPAMIRTAKDAGVPNVYLTTNASRLDRTLAEALVRSGLDRIFASVNADDEEAYVRATGRSYGGTSRRIRSLIALRDRLGSRFPEVFVSVISDAPDPVRRRASIERWLGLADGVVLLNQIRFQGRLAWLSHANNAIPVREPCPDLWNYAGIAADGTLFPCLYRKIVAGRRAVREANQVDPGLTLGRVGDKALFDLWHGDAAAGLRREQIRGVFPPGHDCEGCPFWSFQRMRPVRANGPMSVHESPLAVEIRRVGPGQLMDWSFLDPRDAK